MQSKILFTFIVLVSLVYGQSDSVLIFVSDTQSPMPVEKLYLKDHDNEKMTQKIFHSILMEKNVAAVIHAGDITSHGSSNKEWKKVLWFLDSLKRRSIPFLAAKGNHDYYFFSSSAQKKFARYVPNGKVDFYARTFGATAVIILNSNSTRLSKEEKLRQQQWYASQVTQFDADSAIHSIITVLHHSSFTNSALVGGSEFVRSSFLESFTNSKKSLIMISGHSHRFEHFQKKDKNFFVIGGGGGLFHDKRKQPAEADSYTGADEGKFFHYMRTVISKDSLSIDVIKIDGTFETPKVVYHFKVETNSQK